MTIDRFQNKASNYEHNKNRVDNVENIANSIIKMIKFDKSMHIIDFGSGTGLLLKRVAKHVGKISAVDISSSMNGQLRAKKDELDCEIEILEIDLEKSNLEGEFDGIISSMTMHHIRNIEAMFGKFYSMIKPGGFIAISDLDSEDGSFHDEDTGVFHHGFNRADIAKTARASGFNMVEVQDASVVRKSIGDFPVFLLTAIR